MVIMGFMILMEEKQKGILFNLFHLINSKVLKQFQHFLLLFVLKGNSTELARNVLFELPD